jgi:hypothetical protein
MQKQSKWHVRQDFAFGTGNANALLEPQNLFIAFFPAEAQMKGMPT